MIEEMIDDEEKKKMNVKFNYEWRSANAASEWLIKFTWNMRHAADATIIYLLNEVKVNELLEAKQVAAGSFISQLILWIRFSIRSRIVFIKLILSFSES